MKHYSVSLKVIAWVVGGIHWGGLSQRDSRLNVNPVNDVAPLVALACGHVAPLRFGALGDHLGYGGRSRYSGQGRTVWGQSFRRLFSIVVRLAASSRLVCVRAIGNEEGE